jgi:tellurite resistance protein TehA-like permease
MLATKGTAAAVAAAPVATVVAVRRKRRFPSSKSFWAMDFPVEQTKKRHFNNRARES